MIDGNAVAAGTEDEARSTAPSKEPAFLITIDTEEDDAWSRPRVATTRNAEFLERFQRLCEEHGQRPTWLVTHEMIRSKIFRRFAADVLGRATAEVGMHLHAWNSPPLTPLTADDLHAQPYLVEFPTKVMREKVHALTGELEDALGVKMVSHRAGRWAFDERYAEILLETGYEVDCSVTPLTSWRTVKGAPTGRGGSDYTRFPDDAYWLSVDDISREGNSPLLEVPVTVTMLGSGIARRAAARLRRIPPRHARASRLGRRIAGRLAPPLWLRPDGNNGATLLAIARDILARGRRYGEMVLHSSELMPGCSPTFPDERSIEQMYRDLDALLRLAGERFRGMTLSEFRHDLGSVTETAARQ